VADDAALSAFVEQLGLLWQRYGANRTMGRILGWLMVCDPPEQTAADLAEALGVSRGSVSTATRQLEAAGLAERVGAPGDRRLRYRMTPGGWDATARVRAGELSTLVALAEQARGALAGEPEPRRGRVEEFRDWATWWEQRYGQMLAEWEEQQ